MTTPREKQKRIGRTGWQQHMAAWQASGLSQAAYCRSHDLNPRYFSVWKSKLLAPSGKPADNSLLGDFVSVEVIPDPLEPTIVQLSDGIRLEIPNHLSRDRIQQVFQLMAQLAC